MATKKSIIPEFMKDNPDDMFQQLFFITRSKQFNDINFSYFIN